jgi:hypothetical protein
MRFVPSAVSVTPDSVNCPCPAQNLHGTSARSIWTKDLTTDKGFYSVSIRYDHNWDTTYITDNINLNASGNRHTTGSD